MMLYRKNQRGQLCGGFDMSERDIARRYLASDYATWSHWPLDRKLRLFIACDLNAAWSDQNGYTAVIDWICRLRRKGGEPR